MSDWTAALTVAAEEKGRLLTPRVSLTGRRRFYGGTLRVELVDECGEVRRTVRRPLMARSLGRELALPSFTVPDGASPDEVLGWPWDIVVESAGSEIVRWTRYLEVTTRLNAEGELELSGPPVSERSKQELEGRGPEAPWDARDSKRLLAALVERGEITPGQSAIALVEQPDGGSPERFLIESGWVDERRLWRIYSQLTGTEFVDLSTYPIDPRAVAEIPVEVAREYGLIAIGYRDELLTVAMSDPQHEPALRAAEMFSSRRVHVVVATRGHVLRALDS